MELGCAVFMALGCASPLVGRKYLFWRTFTSFPNLVLKMASKKKDSKRKSKTKFEEFLEMDKNKLMVGYEEDLELERKLAKRLKIKGGRLNNLDDGINDLFDGFSSALDSTLDNNMPINRKAEANDETGNDKIHKRKKLLKEKIKDKTSTDEDNVNVSEVVSSDKKRKRKTKSVQKSNANVDGTNDDITPENVKEVAAGEDTEKSNKTLEENQEGNVSKKYVPPQLRACTNKESDEIAQIQTRVKGLLNKLSVSNVESITQEISSIFQSLPRSVGCQIVGEVVVASCVGGKSWAEQHGAVSAAFVAGMACLVGMDFGAKLIASVAMSFEKYSKDDGPLENFTRLLSYLYMFGVCSSDLMYDLLSVLSKRFTEMDVKTIDRILRCCGMKLRSDDPTAMKDFVFNIRRKANEGKLISENGEDSNGRVNSKHMDFMLDTICNIKNNKKKPEDEQGYTRIKKWLQKLRSEEILLRGITWKKLLDPEKKGQWWLSGEFASKRDNTEGVATTIDKEMPETQKLMQLAAEQRMNTNLRRAIFCIIMSGEDYMDAFEKLLRLNLSGKQDREIMRVLLECCLQEKAFNKYYTVLAAKLCSHDKNNKFTLQYCIWDQYKELDTTELIRSMNLAKFVAEMLSSFSLSLAMLKIVDFMDLSELSARRIMHFRILIEEIFERSDNLIWNIFTRISATPELESLRTGLLFFIKQYVRGTNVAAKLKIVKKALRNAAGILM